MKILSRDFVLSVFFSTLKQGEIFGFSQAFKKDQVISLAEEYGLTLASPAKRSKEYKEHGEYVLKVKRIGIPANKVLHQKEVLYKVERAKRARKCAGYKREAHVIAPSNRCMVTVFADRLPDGKYISKQENYCLECARLLVTSIQHKYAAFIPYLKDN